MSREQIFQAIEDQLNTIDGLLVKFGPLDLNEEVLPVVGIVPVADARVRSSKTGATHVLNLTLRLRSLNAYELEPWTVLLAAKMEEDLEWGGLARDTELDEEGWLFYDPVFPQTGVDMKYKLTY